MTIPIVMTAAGRSNQLPQALRDQLDALVTAIAAPGYTSRLPGSMIEDVASTDTYALVLCDQFVTELINSLTPYGANEFILTQLGLQSGVLPGAESNTSVYVVVGGPSGYLVPVGFTVGDGTYQYSVRDGGAIGTGGVSAPLYALSTSPGTFAVPAGTVTQIETSVSAAFDLTVTNPQPGTPGGPQETSDQYRARVYQANLAPAAGTPSAIKTALQKVPGVQARLVSVRSAPNGGFQVICGGGDPYEAANAIYTAMPDFTALRGSSISGSRNVIVTVSDPPDTYEITFINPPQQTVNITLTWNTSAPNFVSANAVAQIGAPALAAYINSLSAGQPINVYDLERTFREAISGILAPSLVTRLVFAVSINGVGAAPVAGTGLIQGDPESFLEALANSVIVTQG